jgi:hypothetical protein
MRTAFIVTIIVLSMHTMAESRDSTNKCGKYTDKKSCEQFAEIIPSVKLPATKGYACAWKGRLKKTCDTTKTLVELKSTTKTAVDAIEPNPTKFTKSIGRCNSLKDETACNVSFEPGRLFKRAFPCRWSNKGCDAQEFDFSFDQVPIGAFVPKPAGKVLGSSCEAMSAAACEQRMYIIDLVKGKQICGGCRADKHSLSSQDNPVEICAANDAAPLSMCE